MLPIKSVLSTQDKRKRHFVLCPIRRERCVGQVHTFMMSAEIGHGSRVRLNELKTPLQIFLPVGT